MDSTNIDVYIYNYTKLLDRYNYLNYEEKLLSKEDMDFKIKLRKNIVILKYLIRALATCQQIKSMEQSLDTTHAEDDAEFKSPKPIPVANMDVPCMEVVDWVQTKTIQYDAVVESYSIVTNTEGSSVAQVLSPIRSTGASPNYKHDGELDETQEDSLNDLLQSDDYDDECNNYLAEQEDKETQDNKRKKNESMRQETTTSSDTTKAEEYTSQEYYTPSAISNIPGAGVFGFGGSRNNPTRKRKRSKIPRRTIRRRATKRGQKRTIRRQRRNNKRTQKRRK